MTSTHDERRTTRTVDVERDEKRPRATSMDFLGHGITGISCDVLMSFSTPTVEAITGDDAENAVVVDDVQDYFDDGEDYCVPIASVASTSRAPMDARAMLGMVPSADDVMAIMSAAPPARFSCCHFVCLDVLENEREGWIAREKLELDRAKNLRSTSEILSGAKRPRGRPGHPRAYVEKFQAIDDELASRGACAASRLHFVSKKFLYKYYKKRRELEIVARSLSASTDSSFSSGRICCTARCLEDFFVQEQLDELASMLVRSRTQSDRRKLLRVVCRLFPYLCRRAVRLLIGCDEKTTTRMRKALANNTDGEILVHALKKCREECPPNNLNVALQMKLFEFFDVFTCGNPMSETARARITSIFPINGKQGLYKFFIQHCGVPIAQSTFMNMLSRWLKLRDFKGIDWAHVDHNVCPSCKYLRYEHDRLTLDIKQMERARTEEEALSEESEALIQEMKAKLVDLELTKRNHHEHNQRCRRVIRFWITQAKYAAHVTSALAPAYGKPYDLSRLEVSPLRCSKVAIAEFHVDGEASRTIPHVRQDTVGGGFAGRHVKVVAFHCSATGETFNYILPDVLHSESTAMLIDLIMRQALKCRGEKILTLILDQCYSNYSGTLWAMMVVLVDILKWFDAVVLSYYMPRHGKGDADKIFGGHRAIHKNSDVFSDDQLGQAYVDARSGKEHVFIVEATSVNDWKQYIDGLTNGRVGTNIQSVANAWNEIVVARRSILETSFDAAVIDYLRPFISERGWYRMRQTGKDSMHAYCVFPSTEDKNFVPSIPKALLKEVPWKEVEPGEFAIAEWPVNREHVIANGFNNHKFRHVPSFDVDVANSELYFQSPLVPINYRDEDLKAHGRNFIERRPALRENLPRTGPLYPALCDLNIILGRQLYTDTGVEFVSHVPAGKTFLVSCVDDKCAEFASLESYSAAVEADPSTPVTTAHVVEASTPGFRFADCRLTCTMDDFIKSRRAHGKVKAFLKPPNSVDIDVVRDVGNSIATMCGFTND